MARDLSKYRPLANKLRELYPKGMKKSLRDSQTYPWRGSETEIANKLWALENCQEAKFTEEQAIKVTQYYVESFHGNYQYMKLLKYFLLRDNRDGTYTSTFMEYLDNIDDLEGSNESQDWTANLV